MEEISFNLAIKEYFEYKKIELKKSTYDTNTRKINLYILNYFNNKNIYDLNCKDFIKWKIYIENFNFSYNYKSSLYYCFTDFLNFCINYYDLKNNVAKKVGNFKNNEIEKVGNIWTLEEFNQFILAVDNIMYKTLFKLLFFTGLRKGEALALTWNDIDLKNNKINIYKTITREKDLNNKNVITPPKTKKSNRIIFIDDKLSLELKELKDNYVNVNNNDFVFGIKKNISFTTLERKKNYYCKIANVKQIKIHEFRHSHACLLFQNDIEVENISYRLGHSSMSMTMNTYLKYLPRNEKRVINTLNSLRLN